jgi:Flp pilus assembly secretin CpaC
VRHLFSKRGTAFSLVFFLAIIFSPDRTNLAFAEILTEPLPQAEKAESIITEEKTIETRVGEKLDILVDADILDVAVTRPEVADAFVTRSRGIRLSLNSPGVGKIIVKLDNGERVAFTIRVYVADPEAFAIEMEKKIGHIQGINISVIKGKILVDGRVLYLKDIDAIEQAIGDNPSIINLTSLSSRNARILAREIERELRESGIYGARVEVRNNRVTLVGQLGTNLLVKKAEQIASSYTPNFDSVLEVSTDESQNPEGTN